MEDRVRDRVLKSFASSKWSIVGVRVVSPLPFRLGPLAFLQGGPVWSIHRVWVRRLCMCENLSTVSSSFCTAFVLSVSSVLSSANSSVLYSSPELCLYPPPSLSNHLISAFTTTPPSMGERGHPCLKPLCNQIFAVASPLSCTTWK